MRRRVFDKLLVILVACPALMAFNDTDCVRYNIIGIAYFAVLVIVAKKCRRVKRFLEKTYER